MRYRYSNNRDRIGINVNRNVVDDDVNVGVEGRTGNIMDAVVEDVSVNVNVDNMNRGSLLLHRNSNTSISSMRRRVMNVDRLIRRRREERRRGSSTSIGSSSSRV